MRISFVAVLGAVKRRAKIAGRLLARDISAVLCATSFRSASQFLSVARILLELPCRRPSRTFQRACGGLFDRPIPGGIQGPNGHQRAPKKPTEDGAICRPNCPRTRFAV